MADVADLFAPLDTLPVTFPTGVVIPVQYSRLDVTSGMIDPTSTDMLVLARAIAGVVKAWDVQLHGESLDPTKVEDVAKLPLQFCQILLKALIQAQNIDPKS